MMEATDDYFAGAPRREPTYEEHRMYSPQYDQGASAGEKIGEERARFEIREMLSESISTAKDRVATSENGSFWFGAQSALETIVAAIDRLYPSNKEG